MRDTLNIVDFTCIYNKYKFQAKRRCIKSLTYLDRDISLLYYPIHDFEVTQQKADSDCDIAVCINGEHFNYIQKYNPNILHTESTLNQNDFLNLIEIQYILEKVGYSVYVEPHIDTKSLIINLLHRNYKQYQHINIYTDNIFFTTFVNDKISLHLYRNKQGYQEITAGNFTEALEPVLKVSLPLNTSLLYYALCGKVGVNCKGVYHFGSAAFRKLLNTLPLDFSKCSNYKYLLEAIPGYFTDSNTQEEVKDNLKKLTQYIQLDTNLKSPEYIGDLGTRTAVYTQFGMPSCI